MMQHQCLRQKLNWKTPKYLVPKHCFDILAQNTEGKTTFFSFLLNSFWGCPSYSSWSIIQRCWKKILDIKRLHIAIGWEKWFSFSIFFFFFQIGQLYTNMKKISAFIVLIRQGGLGRKSRVFSASKLLSLMLYEPLLSNLFLFFFFTG